jgi:hypothetical protein
MPEWRGIIAKQSAPVLRLKVRGTGHFSFSDALFTRPTLVAEGGGTLTNPLVVLRGTTAVVAAYLRTAMAGDAGTLPPLPEFIFQVPAEP